jgi:hypothetical protein
MIDDETNFSSIEIQYLYMAGLNGVQAPSTTFIEPRYESLKKNHNFP